MTMLLGMPGNEALLDELAALSGTPGHRIHVHRFPDGESLVRLPEGLGGKVVAILCTLADPDPKLVPLALAAGAARDLGARRVILFAPYLAYLRQDRAFAAGQSISARHFGALLSGLFDELVTVDPHLHRIAALAEILRIPATTLGSAQLLGKWAAAHVPNPLIIGPDAESRQWAEAVAGAASAPHVVLEKQRHGDRNVSIHLPPIGQWRGHTPILCDDIISSGATMMAAARALEGQGFPPPVCLCVHALFSPETEAGLRQVAADVVATNSVPHRCSQISIAPLLARALTGSEACSG
jgi:ribose-phosphate pyrophosphokinase